MVVVAIIGLLVGILLPAIAAVRGSARTAQARAQFSALDTGLSMYRGERALGGTLPPSASDHPTDHQLIANPQRLNGRNNGGTNVRIAGAHLLYQAMVGADGLGTPGFKDFGTGSDGRDGRWWNDTHDDAATEPPFGAYALNQDDGRERHTRYGGGGFVDEKMKETARSINDLLDKTVIPHLHDLAEDAAVDEPMFTDPWEHPILYYRATPSARRMVADELAKKSGIYRQEDNGLITGTEGGANPNEGLDFGAGEVKSSRDAEARHHAISVAASPAVARASGDVLIGMIQTQPLYDDSFARYILDPSVKARPTPVRKSDYILISAGPDARYGTADDIANFNRGAQ